MRATRGINLDAKKERFALAGSVGIPTDVRRVRRATVKMTVLR